MNSELMALVTTSVMIGFLGSTHCIAMCGGIASALNLQSSRGPSCGSLSPQPRVHVMTNQTLYAIGRIASYCLAGCLVGALGQTLLQTAGTWALPFARALTGIMMIFIGLYLTQWWPLLVHLERLGASGWRRISTRLSPMLPADRWYKALAVGALWGWLPCGLVYSTLVIAASTHSAFKGAVVMLSFGIGTLPALLSIGFLTQRLNVKRFKTSAGLLLILFGLSSLAFQAYHATAHSGHDGPHSHHHH